MKKYEIVVEKILQMISNKELKLGQRLPTIRELARELGFNKSTIIRAYSELEKNHKIYSITKSGYYLLDVLDEKENTEIIDFSEVVLDPRVLPYNEFLHSTTQAVNKYKSSLFSYSSSQGLETFREIIKVHFEERQIFSKTENIFVTSGSQQALNIISKMKFPSQKEVALVEIPTYNLLLRLLELSNTDIISYRRTFDGFDIKDIEEKLKEKNIKFLYLIPRLHNPLGVSYTKEEKLKILDLAKKHDVYIIEDDYLADMDCLKNNYPFYYYDTSDRVIYLKSFSKAFMPGIRISAVIIPEKLKSEFLKYKELIDLNTSLISQASLEVYIGSGMYNLHIKKIKKVYKKKINYFKSIYDSLDSSNMKTIIPDTGFFIYLVFSKQLDLDLLIERLKKQGVLVTTGKKYYVNQKTDIKSIRLCISGLTNDEIRSGLIKIVSTVNILS